MPKCISIADRLSNGERLLSGRAAEKTTDSFAPVPNIHPRSLNYRCWHDAGIPNASLTPVVSSKADRRRQCSAGQQLGSNIHAFRNFERVIDLNTEISDRALELGVTKKKLNGPKVLRASVDQ